MEENRVAWRLPVLKICYSFQELNITQLMEVYSQSLNDDPVGRYQAKQDFYDYLREEFFSIPNVFYALWSLEGRCVSALRMEPYQDGYLLSGLETALQDRRKGYARKLVNGVLQYLSLEGSFPIYTHVHKKNAASLALHRACGFAPIQDYGVLIDGTVSYNYLTLCHK